MGHVVKDFIYGREFGLYPESTQHLIELLEDREACDKYECYKPWQYKNKNITKENWEEKSRTVDTYANFLNFHSEESTDISKNQSENRDHLYRPLIKGNL